MRFERSWPLLLLVTTAISGCLSARQDRLGALLASSLDLDRAQLVEAGSGTDGSVVKRAATDRSREPAVRARAAEGLAFFPSYENLGALESLARDVEEPAIVRNAALWSQWLVAADQRWGELTGAYRDSLFETVEQLLIDGDQAVLETLVELAPRLAGVLDPIRVTRLMAAAAAAGIDLTPNESDR